MSGGYSDDQVLLGVASAVRSWRDRLERSDRLAIVRRDDARTAILVFDFDELAKIHSALAGCGPVVGRDAMTSALLDEIADWLTTSEPIEPPAA